MNNAMQSVDASHEWWNSPDESSGLVGQAKLDEIENLWSLDELGRHLFESSWLSLEQVKKISTELPPELIQMLEQPEQKIKFKTIIENMALFLASETKKPWTRMAYPLDQIFANAKLWDNERIAQATADLQSLSLTHGFSEEQMNAVQQQRLLDVHKMYPEKWVFELNKSEKLSKYHALLDWGTFDKSQAKLLLDRGYAGVIWKIFGSISKLATWGTISLFILAIILFVQIDWCGIINSTIDITKKAAKTTKEIATPIVNAWVDAAKFFGWWLTYISSVLQSRVVELENLKWEKEAIQQRLIEIKQRIDVIDANEPRYKFRDGKEEDALQDQEEKLEERLVELEEEIFDAEEAMREELANQKRFNAPFRSAMTEFTEKRGDVKGRTAEQWRQFNEYVGSIGWAPGWSEGGKTYEEQKAAEEELLKKKAEEDTDRKWYYDDF